MTPTRTVTAVLGALLLAFLPGALLVFTVYTLAKRLHRRFRRKLQSVPDV